MRLSSRQAAGIASSSVTPTRSELACLAWWIMYMIQVPIGSTITWAPSRSRNGNMLKLPSPSVVWAQNSPVIFTIGLTRRRSLEEVAEAPLQRVGAVALEALVEGVHRLDEGGVGGPRLELEGAGLVA